jgi:hypothetical protein
MQLTGEFDEIVDGRLRGRALFFLQYHDFGTPFPLVHGSFIFAVVQVEFQWTSREVAIICSDNSMII